MNKGKLIAGLVWLIAAGALILLLLGGIQRLLISGTELIDNLGQYLIEEETDAGVARALTRVLAHSDEELFRKGQSARDFVLKERNNVVQAKKILEMLENRK